MKIRIATEAYGLGGGEPRSRGSAQASLYRQRRCGALREVPSGWKARLQFPSRAGVWLSGPPGTPGARAG